MPARPSALETKLRPGANPPGFNAEAQARWTAPLGLTRQA